MNTYSTIAESNNFIVLDSYTKISTVSDTPNGFQSEAALEKEFIEDLISQGYEALPTFKSKEEMLANLRVQLESLNNMKFNGNEWTRFLEEYVDKPGDTIVEKSRKIHDNHIHDFIFDDGHIQNIYLVDKKNLVRNKVQVMNQYEQKGKHVNRYDVTILINGLPLVQIELKKRGVAIREAFNQIHRYSKESFNSDNSLFKYVQLFVISNGGDTRYFANTVKRNKNSFDFTMNWAKADNLAIEDLKDFTATFFQKNTLLNVLFTYSVLDVTDTLLIMRPYQIAATERLLWKIQSSYNARKWSTPEGGGYVWHTTGSGKTLTSFKAARLATQLDFIDKVFFVVDRKDLDYQTMKEYQRFSPDSVNGSASTEGLKRNIEKDDNKIIVTTLQKLNNLMKSENNLPIYQKQVVFIFDEAHRSQFGEAQKLLRKKFKKYYQFGFTGTPIFQENALGAETTASVFGNELHAYVITDAIRDNKVLKFKVDYNNVRPKFKSIEKEQDEKKLTAAENKQALLHPARIKEISQYILNNFAIKTHRTFGSNNGFNAMFAVNSVEAAKLYYEELMKLQKEREHPLKIATIYSFTANEEQDAIGDIQDESFEPTALNSSAKEFLEKAINDYNAMFRTSYSVDSKEFENYYKDLARRVKGVDNEGRKLPEEEKIDLVIVVGMFLTGFDAQQLNTLFVDKNLRYHGLLQAFSRTNRIYDATKTFGNIITFRDLEQATIDSITLFGKKNTRDIILEKSFKEYLQGFTDIITGKAHRGYRDVVEDLRHKFPSPDEIFREADKKEFAKVFGEYLRIENILQNYDEFSNLKELQHIDLENQEEVEAFKKSHFLTDKDMELLKEIDVLPDRLVQDYKSKYNDIRDWLRDQRKGEEAEQTTLDWDDVVFEVDLLKSQEINLDYILELIFDHNKKNKNKAELVEEMRRIIRGSVENRAKEGLIVDFINQTDLDNIKDKASIIDSFFLYAQEKQKEEAAQLIASEQLNQEEAKRYITTSLKKEYASENGTELNSILPKMSPLNPQYLTKKQSVFQKISAFVEKFKGIGGRV